MLRTIEIAKLPGTLFSFKPENRILIGVLVFQLQKPGRQLKSILLLNNAIETKYNIKVTLEP